MLKSSYKENLIKGFMNRTSCIGVLGLGYVGLPLLLSFAEAGFNVIGFDIDIEKVNKLNSGHSYIKHINNDRLSYVKKRGSNFVATNDFALVADADALILCLPTPLNRHWEPDMSFVFGTINSILPYLRTGQLISLESTTYPGTTDEELKPRIMSRGFHIGKDIFLVYSPEREDPGNKEFTTKTIPKIIGGTSPACLEVGISLYRTIVDCVVPVSSTKVAEFTKLMENIYRSVNIALVNELKIIADRMDVDIWEVIDAAATKPFGFTPFYPGPGWGGHCIPIDPFYLSWKARAYGLRTRFIELAGEINRFMPEWVIGKISDGLNIHGKALNGARILILGIAYKKNIDDVRESPAVKIMESLMRKGAVVSYSDPYVPMFPRMRDHYFDLKSTELTAEVLQNSDCVVIATDHDCFDYEAILANSQLIVDTRRRYRERNQKIISC